MGIALFVAIAICLACTIWAARQVKELVAIRKMNAL